MILYDCYSLASCIMTIVQMTRDTSVPNSTDLVSRLCPNIFFFFLSSTMHEPCERNLNSAKKKILLANFKRNIFIFNDQRNGVEMCDSLVLFLLVSSFISIYVCASWFRVYRISDGQFGI